MYADNTSNSINCDLRVNNDHQSFKVSIFVVDCFVLLQIL